MVQAIVVAGFGLATGLGLGLIPSTGAVFEVVGRGNAGPIVGAIFARYSLWQAVLLACITLLATFLAYQTRQYKIAAMAILMLSLHGVWEWNRRDVQSMRPLMQAEVIDETVQARFRSAHRMSVGLLLGLILVGGAATWIAYPRS